MNRITVFFLAVLLTTATTACRSRVKPQPAPPPPPIIEEPALPPTPVAEFPEQPAEPDVFAADIEELNRVARERGWIEDAFFEYDSSALTARAQSALERSSKVLRDRPELALTIEGHCDNRGTEQYNLALGERRAFAAKEYLTTLGIDSFRIRTISYGEERPFATAETESAWAQNRRAHLVLSRAE